MFKNPLTSRTSFLLYGFMTVELLGRIGLVGWGVLIVALSVLESVWDRPKRDLPEEQGTNKGRP